MPKKSSFLIQKSVVIKYKKFKVVRRNFFCRSGDTQKKNYDHLVVRDPKKVGNPWCKWIKMNLNCIFKWSFVHHQKKLVFKLVKNKPAPCFTEIHEIDKDKY